MNLKHKSKLLLVVTLLLLSISSCKKENNMNGADGKDGNCTQGEGSIIMGEGAISTQVLSLSDFNEINLSISSNVTVTQGTTQEVKAIGHPNIIEKLKTAVSNNLWNIELEGGCYGDYQLFIEITVPNISLLKISGSGNITVNDFSNQSALKSVINGSGDMILNKFEGITIFDATLSGSGSFTANNDITTLGTSNITSSGSGNYLGFEISSNNSTVNSSGSGSSEFTTVSLLNVTLSGSGNVSYKGTPTITQDITGSGSLINAN